MQPTISATGISKAFVVKQIRTIALQDVSIDIFQGELTLIIGPSGCGKSTLLATLSGLTIPDSGAIRTLGTDLVAASDAERDSFRLHHCGFVFQGFNLFPALTAVESCLENADPQTRGVAVWCLAQAGRHDRLSARENLRSDAGPVRLYRNGTLVDTTVGELAGIRPD